MSDIVSLAVGIGVAKAKRVDERVRVRKRLDCAQLIWHAFRFGIEQ